MYFLAFTLEMLQKENVQWYVEYFHESISHFDDLTAEDLKAVKSVCL